MTFRRTLLLFLCIVFFVAPLLSHAIESDPLGNCPGQNKQGRTRLSVHIPGVSKREELTPGLKAEAIEALKAAATPGGIPGAVATAAARVNKVNSKYCYYVTGDLVDYIKGLYTFGLTVGGFLAVVMIMIGGIIWAGAGGNPELIKKGQQRVLNAIFGLVLLLASYTILNLINPDLVKLERINPDSTTKEDLTIPSRREGVNQQGLTSRDVDLLNIAKNENAMEEIGKMLSDPKITQNEKEELEKIFTIFQQDQERLKLQESIKDTRNKLASPDNTLEDVQILQRRLNILNLQRQVKNTTILLAALPSNEALQKELEKLKKQMKNINEERSDSLTQPKSQTGF